MGTEGGQKWRFCVFRYENLILFVFPAIFNAFSIENDQKSIFLPVPPSHQTLVGQLCALYPHIWGRSSTWYGSRHRRRTRKPPTWRCWTRPVQGRLVSRRQTPTGGSLCGSSGCEPPRVSYGPESHTVHAHRGSSLDSLCESNGCEPSRVSYGPELAQYTSSMLRAGFVACAHTC